MNKTLRELLDSILRDGWMISLADRISHYPADVDSIAGSISMWISMRESEVNPEWLA